MGGFLDSIKFILGEYCGVAQFKQDLYNDNYVGIGSWQLNTVDVRHSVRTRGGFKLACVFTVWLKKVHPVEFRNCRMLEEGAAEQLAWQYTKGTVEPHHYSTGYYAYEFIIDL